MEQLQHKMLLTVAHNMLTNSKPQEGALNRKLEEARGQKNNTKPPFPLISDSCIRIHNGIFNWISNGESLTESQLNL